MKTLLMTAALLWCGYAVFSQNNDSNFAKATDLDKAITTIDITSPDIIKKLFTENYELTETFDKAKFIRICKRKTGELWSVNDFYVNGFLKMEGVFSDIKNEVKEGEFSYFYPYNILESQGKYENGVLEGEWKFYFPNGNLSAIEVYDNGVRKKEEYFEENGNPLADKNLAEKRATFVGGTTKLYRYFAEKLVPLQDFYPQKLPAKLVLSFWVNTEGSIEDAKIVQPVQKKLDTEILKIVTAMPKWIPAKRQNRPIREQFTLPLTLDLN
jgi:TonB family protein